MNDFSMLSSAWIEWTKRAGMPGASVSLDCPDCEILFTSDDESFHLRQSDGWWIIDETDDRGKRYNATAKFSTLELVEKYLVWRWASTTRTVLGAEPLGPRFYRAGFSSDVSLAPTQSEWRVELKSPAGNAILSQPDSTIFSHLMSKSLDEVKHLVSEGIP